MMTATRPRDRSLIFLLAACGGIASVATNLFLPALPQIQAYFGATLAAAQSILSVYMMAFAGSILVVGPLSDRFGRRPVMIGGLLVFAVGSMMAVASNTLATLVFGRIVQAAGASAGLILSRAIVGDLYEGAALARRMAMLTMVVIASTTASPFLGGLIADAFGWHGAFWVQAGAGVLFAAACWWRLPETRSQAHRSGGFAGMLVSGRQVLSQPAFFAYVLQSGVIFSIFMVFVSITPYIMSRLDRPASEFGLYYMLLAGGYFLGNMHVSRRAHAGNVERTTHLGLALQLAAAVVGLGLVFGGLTHPIWIFGPMLPMAFGQGLAMPNLMARVLELAPGYAGVATSLLTFAQQIMAAFAVQAMGWAPTDSAVPLLLFCTAAALLALVPTFGRPRAR